MDEIDRQHERFLAMVDAEQKARRGMANNKARDSMFRRRNNRFETLEDKAYSKYYKHMHKDFDVKGSPISFTSGKYKEKFCDVQYINDMYNHKKKQFEDKKILNKSIKKEKRANARGLKRAT